MCSILLPFPSSRFQGWKKPTYIYIDWFHLCIEHEVYKNIIAIPKRFKLHYSSNSHIHLYRTQKKTICISETGCWVYVYTCRLTDGLVQIIKTEHLANENVIGQFRRVKKNIEFRCFNDTEDAQHSMRPQFVDFCRSMVSIVCSSSVVWPPVAGHVVCLTFLYID